MPATDPLSEARWTKPRPDCPHPEWWHSTDDESSELEVSAFLAGLVRLLQPSLVVETGAAFGQTSEAIAIALAQNGHGRLDSLERDPGRAAIAARRVAGLPATVLLLESGQYEPPRPINLAFLDSAIDARVDELRGFRRRLAPGAIAVFHDAGPQHGIRASIEALADEGWIRFAYFPTPRGLLLGEVIRPVD